MNALILVDLQNDFTPSGALPVGRSQFPWGIALFR